MLQSGKMLTAMMPPRADVELIDAGKPLPVSLRRRVIYYVRAVRDELVVPAGPNKIQSYGQLFCKVAR